MTNFVLVHGGSRDAGVWSEVRAGLEHDGHRAVCPSLPDAATSSLEEHVETVCRDARASGFADIRLVGHSYGGLVITVASTKITDLVNRLVYLDTAYPVAGQSLFDLAAHEGVDPQEAGVDPDPPFVTPLDFDTAIWRAFPKVYVRALRSEFAPMSRAAERRVRERAREERWTSFEIDSRHNMMQDVPGETVALLERIA